MYRARIGTLMMMLSLLLLVLAGCAEDMTPKDPVANDGGNTGNAAKEWCRVNWNIDPNRLTPCALGCVWDKYDGSGEAYCADSTTYAGAACSWCRTIYPEHDPGPSDDDDPHGCTDENRHDVGCPL